VAGFLVDLGIRVPIVLAPMDGAVGPDLVAAVSNAGGLGVIPLWSVEPSVLTQQMQTVRRLTSKPFGVNLNNQFPQDDHLAAAIDEGARIVSFFWGINQKRVMRAKMAGLVVMQTVGTAAEAREAVDAGADVVVAQGWEAGGHVWGTVTTLALVPAVVDAVPSVAAGGVADGRGLAAVLALGASAAWIGTRFLLAEEATVDQTGRDRIGAATEADTVMGKDANPDWLDSGVRWIGGEPSGEYRPPDRQLAGQSVGLVHRAQSAAQIVTEVWDEAQETMKRLSQAPSAST
jgi:NAD(P)H-dependent flavin oxidoreductase YrpB (nitropropane dioxygenase family)